MRDLLDFSRPEAPRSEDGPRASDVGAVLADVSALAAPQKEFRDVSLETDSTSPFLAMPGPRLNAGTPS
ncbi:MAG: hypothetical protein IPK71_11895 [Myxococcales bacterium]|nr:hypothetical protein [Myxococcales bacterium]